MTCCLLPIFGGLLPVGWFISGARALDIIADTTILIANAATNIPAVIAP